MFCRVPVINGRCDAVHPAVMKCTFGAPAAQLHKHSWIERHSVQRCTGGNQNGSPIQRSHPAADTINGKSFSNLNTSLTHEPGTVWGSALLIAGTTVGAGVLALPAVTQDAGFLPAASTLTSCCIFSIVTGLLVAEVTLNIIRESGAGSISILSMANRTLGRNGSLLASAAYLFLHYALLVAYISKAAEILGSMSGLPMLPAAAVFAGGFAFLCYASSQQQLDKLNGLLVTLVVASFLGLLAVAIPAVDGGSLLQPGDWAAVPATLPVIALSFVYHNVTGVVCQVLEGDASKVRQAICAGVAIPWAMFISWEAAVLGSLETLQAAQAQPAVSHLSTAGSTTATRASSAVYSASHSNSSEVAPALKATHAAPTSSMMVAASVTSSSSLQQQQQQWEQKGQQQGQPDEQSSSLHQHTPQSAAQKDVFQGQQAMTATTHLQLQPSDVPTVSAASNKAILRSPTDLSMMEGRSREDGTTTAEADDASSGQGHFPGSGNRRHVDDPLAALAASSTVLSPLIQSFSFLAIATSYIGFILGLTDFLADALTLPSGRQNAVLYAMAVLPPAAVAVTYPDIFLRALDIAGTAGVLTLFGILPPLMAWQMRYSVGASVEQRVELVPGGRVVLLLVGGVAATVILNASLHFVQGSQ